MWRSPAGNPFRINDLSGKIRTMSKPVPQEENSPDEQTVQAFLVVDGSRVVLLDQQVTRIGRKRDNHVVIDNEHVSRHHAEIREAAGRYVLLDLNSTGGTTVNGKRVQKHTLRPGDVVSLAGVPLIFGQGTSRPVSNPPEVSRPVDTGPTKKKDIKTADDYLHLFEVEPD